ncbi:MAG TPA: serine hydrolase domain-containing protein [Parafilimonas sp.]|nr:serine hydrolase domain-containing protein [Parafilimonas sp.]
MIKLIYLLFLIATLSTSCAQTQQNSYSTSTEDTIKMVENGLSGAVQIQDSVNTWNIEDRMKAKGINGVSIAVIRNYKIAWAKGYGRADKDANTPVTTQTLFQAASLSKSLNAVGVLKLAQDKKIDLYTDINQYLKSWKFPYDTVSHGKKITIANLLSHTAGLTVHGFGGYETGDSIPTLEQILDGKHPANSDPVRSMFEPGLRSEYSGGGTTIAQQIVMDVTGEPYATYMQQNVLDPLGMTMSSYQQPPARDKEKYLSTGYRGNGEVIKGKYHIYPEQAAAGLWTNPTDLAKYIIETQLSLQGKSSKVLNAEFTKLRLTPYIDSSAAFGVFIMEKGGVKYFSHGGANEGFRCQYFGSFDGGNGVVVMVNSDDGSIMNEIINSVASVYQWKDFYTPTVRKAIAVTKDMIDAYSGKYVLDKDTVTISADEGKTLLHVSNGENYRIYFSTEQDFFSPELPFDLKFEKDNSGRVTNIYFKSRGREMRAMRLQ